MSVPLSMYRIRLECNDPETSDRPIDADPLVRQEPDEEEEEEEEEEDEGNGAEDDDDDDDTDDGYSE